MNPLFSLVRILPPALGLVLITGTMPAAWGQGSPGGLQQPAVRTEPSKAEKASFSRAWGVLESADANARKHYQQGNLMGAGQEWMRYYKESAKFAERSAAFVPHIHYAWETLMRLSIQWIEDPAHTWWNYSELSKPVHTLASGIVTMPGTTPERRARIIAPLTGTYISRYFFHLARVCESSGHGGPPGAEAVDKLRELQQDAARLEVKERVPDTSVNLLDLCSTIQRVSTRPDAFLQGEEAERLRNAVARCVADGAADRSTAAQKLRDALLTGYSTLLESAVKAKAKNVVGVVCEQLSGLLQAGISPAAVSTLSLKSALLSDSQEHDASVFLPLMEKSLAKEHQGEDPAAILGRLENLTEDKPFGAFALLISMKRLAALSEAPGQEEKALACAVRLARESRARLEGKAGKEQFKTGYQTAAAVVRRILLLNPSAYGNDVRISVLVDLLRHFSANPENDREAEGLLKDLLAITGQASALSDPVRLRTELLMARAAYHRSGEVDGALLVRLNQEANKGGESEQAELFFFAALAAQRAEDWQKMGEHLASSLNAGAFSPEEGCPGVTGAERLILSGQAARLAKKPDVELKAMQAAMKAVPELPENLRPAAAHALQKRLSQLKAPEK